MNQVGYPDTSPDCDPWQVMSLSVPQLPCKVEIQIQPFDQLLWGMVSSPPSRTWGMWGRKCYEHL